MFEDGVALGSQLFRADGYSHLDVLNFPFSPGSAVHPDAAIFQPFCSGLFFQVDGCKDGVCADTVCTVGVGQVAGHEDLVRCYLAQQVAYNLHVGFADGVLLNLACLVEGQVEEVAMIQGNVVVGAGSTGLATAYQSLDGQDVARIHVAILLLGQELADFGIFLVDDLVGALVEELVEAVDEVEEANNLFIAHGDVTARLVGHVDIVLLLHQSADGAAHRDDVVVGVGREDHYALGIGVGPFRTVGIIRIRLPAWPSRDGVLQVVENLDVGVVC